MKRFVSLTFLLLSCADVKEKTDKRNLSDFYFVGSVYMMGNRAGWEEIKAFKVGDIYDFNEEMYIKVLMLGLVKEMRTVLKAEIDNSGGIKKLSYNLSTQDQNISADGIVEGGKFRKAF